MIYTIARLNILASGSERNAIDFNKKDRAKRYHKSSILNLQYSIPACPGWVKMSGLNEKTGRGGWFN
jgi:hypothetical protein